MKRHLLLLFVSCALSFMSARPSLAATSADITTEDGLRVELDRLESRYEAVCARLGEAAWQGHGPDASAAMARPARDAAFKELAVILADPKLPEIFDYWMKRNTITRDPGLIRRVVLWHRIHGVASITLEPKLRAMEEDLAARIAADRPVLDGARMTRAELQAIVVSNPDPARRRSAWLALAGPPVSPLKTDVWKLIRQRAVLSQPIKEHWFHDLIYQAQDLPPYWTFNMMEVLVKRTESAYQELLASLRAALKKQTLQPWDLDYAMEKLAAGRSIPQILQTRFKPDKAESSARWLLEEMGFDLSKVPLKLETATLPFPSEFIPVTVPTDLRAVVSPPAGSAGIIPYYEQVFRMHGRAAQSAFNKQSSPMLKGYPWIPGALNGVYAEGIAAGFTEFLRDPVFLSRRMGLTPAEIDVFLRHERDRRLLEMRRILLAMSIEFTVYVNPDAELDERYQGLARSALGVDMSVAEATVWRSDPMLVSRPVQHQDLMLAESIGLALHDKLVSTFGADRLGSDKPAGWLIERCFAPGENLKLQERLHQSIEGGFDFDALVKSYSPSPGAPAPSKQ